VIDNAICSFQCQLQHILECLEFLEFRKCPRGVKCPLPHKKKPSGVKAGKKVKPISKKRKNSCALGELPTSKKNDTSNSINKKPISKKRYFDTLENDDSTVSDSSGVDGTIHEHRVRQDISGKRVRIMKLVDKLKVRNDAMKVSNESIIRVTPIPINKGKFQLADEKDVVFIEPLDKFVTEDKLPDFIPL